MSSVLIRPAVYDIQAIRAIVSEMLSPEAVPALTTGSRVLLKPNFLQPAAPDKALTTHPLILRAVAEIALDSGAHVQISDSPAIGSFARLLKKGGYAEALQGLDVTLRPFEETIPVDVGEPFGTIDVARDAMEADVVINLAKLKTHAQMTLTLGVKNLFGCIVGLEKPKWHMRAGVDRHLFGRLIVSIFEAIRPAYTIVDGILAMEGQGPGKSGTPRALGLLFGGKNGHAVDQVICRYVGLAPEALETQRNAMELSVYDGQAEVDGDFAGINDFQFPEMGSLTMGPEFLGRFMRRFVIQRPTVDPRICKLCGECWQYCPADAITHADSSISFNTDTCIRCYCCLEVCPHAAIRAKTPLVGGIIEWMRSKR
ncbi:conserved hypothetical protein [Desulfosarcina cetonica]|uniref:DUF362 domain-containing protein n=1 Tax=Desulfosarcina cetonica TaxID=90730 RepID=UPI0006CFD96A|nr:DUF362 domain-containing protein [Desulfosarcina cetonica]VTR69195.1 conserved hypothetical protein [Desulfosarcina cetonica]